MTKRVICGEGAGGNRNSLFPYFFKSVVLRSSYSFRQNRLQRVRAAAASSIMQKWVWDEENLDRDGTEASLSGTWEMCGDGTWLHLPWLGAKGDVIAAQQPLAALFCNHSGAVVLLLWGTNKLSLAYFPLIFFGGLVPCSRYGLLVLSLLILLCCTLTWTSPFADFFFIFFLVLIFRFPGWAL